MANYNTLAANNNQEALRAEFEKSLVINAIKTMKSLVPYIVQGAIMKCGLTFKITSEEKAEIERILINVFNGDSINSDMFVSCGKDSELEKALKEQILDKFRTHAKYMVRAASIDCHIATLMSDQEEADITSNLIIGFSTVIM